MSTNRKDVEPVVVTSVRLSPEKLDRLRAIAESEHRTVSQELRRLVDARVETYEEPERTAA